MSTLQKRRYPRTSLRPKFSSLNIWFIYNKTTPLCLNQKVFPSQMYLRKCSIHHQIHSVAINNVSPPLSLITQSVKFWTSLRPLSFHLSTSTFFQLFTSPPSSFPAFPLCDPVFSLKTVFCPPFFPVLSLLCLLSFPTSLSAYLFTPKWKDHPEP